MTAVPDPGPPVTAVDGPATTLLAARRGGALRTRGRLPVIVGTTLLVVVVGAVVLAPWYAPHGYNDQDLLNAMREPGEGGTLLGTDQLGRDMFSRVLYGGRMPLFITGTAVLLSVVFGVLAGLVTGFRGGTSDHFVGRLADVQLSVPAILLALVVLAFAGNSATNLILVLAAASWPGQYRIARSYARSVRNLPYIEAATIHGASRAWVVRRHLVPGILPLVAVTATTAFSGILVVSASLGYLGLGVPPPTPDWGSMVSAGQSQLGDAWWLSVAPGVALLLVLLGVQLVGDWLANRLSVHGLTNGPEA